MSDFTSRELFRLAQAIGPRWPGCICDDCQQEAQAAKALTEYAQVIQKAEQHYPKAKGAA